MTERLTYDIVRLHPSTLVSLSYDPNSYFNRPFTDPAVCWTGTRNGAWDAYTQQQYPAFQGWNAISLATLGDKDPTNDLSPQAAQRLWEWQRRRDGDITKPDYNIDLGFGGPIPLVGSSLGNMRFFVSHVREQDMFIVPLSRDAYTDNRTQLKLTSDITSTMKLTVMGMYSEDNSVSPYEWTTAPTGYLMRDQAEIADLLTSTDGMNALSMPDRVQPQLGVPVYDRRDADADADANYVLRSSSPAQLEPLQYIRYTAQGHIKDRSDHSRLLH